MRRTYYQRDIHAIAQRGIHWMLRGAVQLALYRIVIYFNDRYTLDRVNSLHALLATMVLTYLLYMRISGQYHLAVGMLLLFGYDLPETYRRYLLASSLTDFWRRANIYWKDFMLKIVYYPAFFSIRKRGFVPAQVIATLAVFAATWGLHAYQSFWLTGQWGIRWTDSIFWMALGLLFLGTMLWENRRGARRKETAGWRAKALHAAGVAATFSTIAFLWFFWSAPSLDRWLFLMTNWRRGYP
jgi:D-alanyl-lipoteichoic acid acyltransferase DltB (MBOAT superfamily)